MTWCRGEFVQSSRVDFLIVRAYEKLERQLIKLGVEVKPDYRIEPPLGSFRSDSQIPPGLESAT